MYLDVLRNCDEERDIVKELRKVLPTRIESQIRAHHTKMMKKYGSVDNILMCTDRRENKKLLEINLRVENCLKKMKDIVLAV